nr:putative trans-2-enoyl-coa reductase, mitochondrial [Quercus suber]
MAPSRAGAVLHISQSFTKSCSPLTWAPPRWKPSPLSQHQARCISAYGYEQAKCLTIEKLGEPKDVLTLHGHSISPPHGELLTLRFLASPINPADINQIQGVYPTKPNFTTDLGSSTPIAVGGNEGVAEVIAAGNGVKGVRKGDWVIMKKQGFGTWRTHAQTTEDAIVPIRNRDGLKSEQVGTVSVNPMTAYRMLRDFVPLQAGEWFIQNGANSGVGRAAIQLGKLWGYKSINVIRKRDTGVEELKAELRSLGADVVVTDEELEQRSFRDQVKEVTNGGREPIRLGLNCVGGSIVNAMAKHLAPNSHMVTYGAMSKQPVSLPTGLLIFKNIAFDGFWVSKWSNENPQDKEKCVQEVLDLTREGKFKDTPMQPVTWDYDTKQEELVEAVQGTLEGFRSGKGIFVFGKT